MGPGIVHPISGSTSYTMFPGVFDAKVLDEKYWSPQNIVGDLATAQGHLELFAANGGNNFATSARARPMPRCRPASLNPSGDEALTLPHWCLEAAVMWR